MRKEKYITERKFKSGICFEVNIRYYENGERKTHSKKFNSSHYITKQEALKEAIRYRDEMLRRLDTVGIVSKKEMPIVRQVYEEKKVLFPMAKETIRKHDVYFNMAISEYADLPIDKVNARIITLSLNKLISKDELVIKRVFAIWKQIIKCAIISDYIYIDPTIKVIVPKSEKINKPRSVEMRCSLPEVIAALKDYGTSYYTKFNADIISYALITMYYLGLRPSECFALNKSDFNLDDKTVIINKAVGSTYESNNVIKTAKNKNSIRTLPLPDDLIPYIKEVMEIQHRELLFARADGKVISSRYFPDFINHACKKAGIEFRSYMLRHKFSTDLITNNVDLRTIQELMGHKNSSMTVSYARSNDKLKRDAINMKK